MSQAFIRRQYDSLCSIYDAVFSALLKPGRDDVVQAVNALPVSRVLEVGVGTGLSLPMYRPDIKIIGVDISTQMLERAGERVQQHGLANVTLLQMDAELLRFSDNSFDAVVALYVVSTTQDPTRLMRELERVCRPGGKIFILNHFSKKEGIMRLLEQLVRPVTKRIGWESYFSKSRIYLPSLRLTRAKRTNLFGYWEMLEFETA